MQDCTLALVLVRVAASANAVDHTIEDGTIPAVHIGRRVLIPRRPFLQAFGVDEALICMVPPVWWN